MDTNQDPITPSDEDVNKDMDEEVTARTSVAAITEQVPAPELTEELSRAVFSNEVVSLH